MDGIQNFIQNPEITPEQSHENWVRGKAVDGWVYGETKDFEAKTHPCMVPYEQLPEEQRAKDRLFLRVVRKEIARLLGPVSVTFFERHGWVLHSDFIRNKEDDDYERETVLQRDGKTIALKMPAGPVPKEFAICVEAVDAFGNVYTGRRECVATDESNDRSVQVWVKRNADSVND